MGLEINKIYCMDCLEGLKLIEDESVDLIVTDPPYDCDYGKKSEHLSKFGKAGKKQIDRDKHFEDKFLFDYQEFSNLLFQKLKNDSHLYIFCSEKQFTMWWESLKNAGFKINNYLVWVKNRQTLDMTFGLKYNYKTELIIFARKGVKKLNKLGFSNVLEYKTGKSLKHSCQKPDDLIRFLIQNSSDEGDLVLDPFMGSGTTGYVAKQMKRDFIGFEIAQEYCNIANNRLKQEVLF